MKKAAFTALVIVIMAALLGAAPGKFADIICDPPKGTKADINFIFVDETGNEIYSELKEGVGAWNANITIKVNSGEIEDVVPTVGRFNSSSIDGAEAVLSFSCPNGSTETIWITVSGAELEEEGLPLAVSVSEARKMLQAAGVEAADAQIESVSMSSGLGETEFVKSGENFIAEIGKAFNESTTFELNIAYSSAVRGQITIPSGTVSVLTAFSGWELFSAKEVYVVKFVDSVSVIETRYVEEGSVLGPLPEYEAEGFSGWTCSGEAVGSWTEVGSNMTIEAGFSEEADSELVYISNDDGEFVSMLESEFGPIDDYSFRARLEGRFEHGNENYYKNGWEDDGTVYIVYNCDANEGDRDKYENKYVSYRDFTALRIYAEANGQEISKVLSEDELYVDYSGGVWQIALKPRAFTQLDTSTGWAYMDGRGERLFAPEENITRGEACAIFFRCLTAESRAALTQREQFGDVDVNDWFYDAVTKLAAAGAIDGWNGMFAPDTDITRAEFTALAVRTANIQPISGTYFADAAGHWAEGEINAAARLGIIGGYPDGSFRPDARITRAEAVTILNGILGREGSVPGWAAAWDDVLPGAWYFADVALATTGEMRE